MLSETPGVSRSVASGWGATSHTLAIKTPWTLRSSVRVSSSPALHSPGSMA